MKINCSRRTGFSHMSKIDVTGVLFRLDRKCTFHCLWILIYVRNCWLIVADVLILTFYFREKKKEKEREELWKQLEKLELESRNKSTSSASNPGGSNPNPASSPGTSGTATKSAKSWTSSKAAIVVLSRPPNILIRVTVFKSHSVTSNWPSEIIINFHFEERWTSTDLMPLQQTTKNLII